MACQLIQQATASLQHVSLLLFRPCDMLKQSAFVTEWQCHRMNAYEPRVCCILASVGFLNPRVIDDTCTGM